MFLISLIYTILIITIYYNHATNTIIIPFIIFYPSPLYFALFGIVRQLIYKKRHHLFISTFILTGTIIIIYGLYYIIDLVINFGISKVYWFGFIGSPAYVLQHAAIPAFSFCIGSMVVKVIQYICYKFSMRIKN